MTFKCERCGNIDTKYFGIRNGKTYCRKCLSFSKKDGENKEVINDKKTVLKMDYPLTQEQHAISKSLISKINTSKEILIYAVCGAGKTEIVSPLIYKYLSERKRVAFFIPRKDLVIEIGDRLKYLFPNTSISLVYGGRTSNLSGSLIVATTHQAFRFNNAFDLVIIDEIDAFPYKDDDLLNYFVFKSAKGPIVSLSATPSQKDMNNKDILCLYKRFHGLPMPIPKVIQAAIYHQKRIINKLLKKYQKENKPCFIYVPTIKDGKKLIKSILRKYKFATFVYSTMPNREQTLAKIRQGHFTIVVTTTILERGVTFSNLQVIVYDASHFIFDKATLLQICGRVGRKAKFPDGDIYFLTRIKKNLFKECIQQVEKYNENL